MNAVELADVTKAFGTHVAVDRLSLDVPVGSIYGFIGPNGSGKTTTLRMIVNILYPDRGSIRVFGERILGSNTDQIGYMPEERGLYRRMRVRDLLRFYGRLKSGNDPRKEVDRWLELFDLTKWAGEKVETLSKGMSQRVQFIAAVVSTPRLLILDEPFTGLDPVNAEVVREAVLELQRQGATVILSTHDMNIAEGMCDSIFMIFQGRKVLDGTMAAIHDTYGNDAIRVTTDGGRPALVNLEGVEQVSHYGQVQEFRIASGYDPHDVLLTLIQRTRIQSFEIGKLSLHEIFLRIAAPEKVDRVGHRPFAPAVPKGSGEEDGNA